jgi:hypothetical protein
MKQDNEFQKAWKENSPYNIKKADDGGGWITLPDGRHIMVGGDKAGGSKAGGTKPFRVSRTLPSGAKMPNSIRDLIEEEYKPNLDPQTNAKRIVDTILDWPEGNDWFNNKYSGGKEPFGNEFDLRQDIEEHITPEED